MGPQLSTFLTLELSAKGGPLRSASYQSFPRKFTPKCFSQWMKGQINTAKVLKVTLMQSWPPHTTSAYLEGYSRKKERQEGPVMKAGREGGRDRQKEPCWLKQQTVNENQHAPIALYMTGFGYHFDISTLPSLSKRCVYLWQTLPNSERASTSLAHFRGLDVLHSEVHNPEWENRFRGYART